MYTIYAQGVESTAWLFQGSYKTASEAAQHARVLVSTNHKVEIDSSEVPVVSDFFD